jgi:hypothetical protein
VPDTQGWRGRPHKHRRRFNLNRLKRIAFWVVLFGILISGITLTFWPKMVTEFGLGRGEDSLTPPIKPIPPSPDLPPAKTRKPEPTKGEDALRSKPGPKPAEPGDKPTSCEKVVDRLPEDMPPEPPPPPTPEPPRESKTEAPAESRRKKRPPLVPKGERQPPSPEVVRPPAGLPGAPDPSKVVPPRPPKPPKPPKPGEKRAKGTAG